jgi:cAMP-dependent protein kinase regulator
MFAPVKTDLKRLRAEAAEAQAKANYRKALALYEEVCEADAADALAHHRAGELFARLGKPAEAVRRLREAADLYADQGFLVKSIAVCKMILQIDASHEETQQHLVELYARKADTAQKPAPAPAPAPPPKPAAPPARPSAGPSSGEVDIASIESIPLADSGGAWSGGDPSAQPAMHLMGNVLDEGGGTAAPEPEPMRPAPPRAPMQPTHGSNPPPQSAPRTPARAAPPPASRDAGDLEIDLPDSNELLDLGLTGAPVPATPAAKPAPPPAASAAPSGGKRKASEIRGATPRALPREAPAGSAAPPSSAPPSRPPQSPVPAQVPPARPAAPAPTPISLTPVPPAPAPPAPSARTPVTLTPVAPTPARPAPVTLTPITPTPLEIQPPAGSSRGPVPVPPPASMPPPFRPSLGVSGSLMAARGSGSLSVQPISVSSGADDIDAIEISIDDVPELSAAPAAARRDLPTTPLFEGLDAATLRSLIDRLEYQRFDSGQMIAHEGEVGDAMFVVVDGEVQILTGQPPREIGRLHDGDFFGEVAIISNFPRVASVVALRETEVLRLSRAVVWELTERHPDFLARLIKFVRDRLVNTLTNTSPLFLTLPPAERAQLASQFRLLEVEEGREVVKQGHRSEGLFVLLGGRFALSIENGGEASPLGELGPGAIVGEVSLLTRQPAAATVRTVNRCWVLWMSPQTFTEVLMTYPTVLEYVHELAEQRRQAVASIKIP